MYFLVINLNKNSKIIIIVGTINGKTGGLEIPTFLDQVDQSIVEPRYLEDLRTTIQPSNSRFDYPIPRIYLLCSSEKVA